MKNGSKKEIKPKPTRQVVITITLDEMPNETIEMDVSLKGKSNEIELNVMMKQALSSLSKLNKLSKL